MDIHSVAAPSGYSGIKAVYLRGPAAPPGEDAITLGCWRAVHDFERISVLGKRAGRCGGVRMRDKRPTQRAPEPGKQGWRLVDEREGVLRVADNLRGIRGMPFATAS